MGLIISIYLLFGLVNSFLLPLHKAPDEIAHFQYIRFIAQYDRLPLTYEERDEAGYRSDWPALYHILAATLIGWSDSDQPPNLKFVWESPRYELARELLDTKRLANTEDELFPYQGAVLMWYLARLVSLVLSSGTIIVAFFTARELFPKNDHLALIAAALAAFIPTFIFISASVSDDSLMGLVGGLYMWILVRIFKRHTTGWYFIAFGLLLGLSATTKYTAVILPLEVVVILGYLTWRSGWGWRLGLARLATVAITSMVASSWWYLFLIRYFNEIETYGLVVGIIKPIIAGGVDRSQRYAAYVLTGGQIGISDSPEFISEPFWKWVLQTYQSFWVVEIGTYPLGPLAQGFAGLILIITAVGLVHSWRKRPGTRVWISLFLFHSAVMLIFPLVRYAILRDLTQSAQGRHLLFPTVTIIPLLFVLGWQGVTRFWQRGLPLVLLGFLLLWNLAQTIRIASFYDSVHTLLPVTTTPNALQNVQHPLSLAFGDHLQLRGYNLDLQSEAGALALSLYWQSESYPDEDYRRRVMLVRDEQLYRDWLSYPTNALYPTRIWESHEIIRDDLLLPLAGLPAGDYELQIQLQQVHGPILVDKDAEVAVLTTVTLSQPPADPPSNVPLTATVDGRAAVQQVHLWQAEAYTELGLPKYLPRMTIPFVWTGQSASNEQVAWLLISETGQGYPAEQTSAGLVVFRVGLDWPSGPYRLRAEVWQGEDVIASEETPPILTIFNERPRLVVPPAIQHPLEANFDNKLKLLGYDLPLRRLSSGQGVPLKLYWQGFQTMDRSYTVFTKLLDSEQQVWGSAERLPADGYNTIYWLENEVVIDGFELLADLAIPDGIYWLNVGLYEEVVGEAVSLPLIAAEQVSEVTSVTFGPLQIGDPPSGVVVSTASPENPVNVVLGDQIELLGFDLDMGKLAHQSSAQHAIQITRSPANLPNSPAPITLTFYWQSLAQTTVDYTAFVHVRNQADETVAQMDRLVTDNIYPTSLWSPGQIIPDTIEVMLPADLPTGEYTLWVGLYDLATGTRLPITEW